MALLRLASSRAIRMVSSDFSRRLCAFSVFSARILKATAGSGTNSAITVFTPSFLSAWSRWLPFGVKYWPSSRTATIGSRKMLIFSITVISFLTCASDASRWYGVGSTRSTGSATTSSGVPPNGSRYRPMIAPPSASTSAASRSRSAPPVSRISAVVSPTDAGGTFLRRTGFLRGGIPA